MVIATVASLADAELGMPSKCRGWTRARDHPTWPRRGCLYQPGRRGPYRPRDSGVRVAEKRDAGIEAGAKRSAADLVADLEQANARLLEAFQALAGRGAGGDSADVVLRPDRCTRCRRGAPGVDHPPR